MKKLKGSYISYFIMYFSYFASIAFLSSLISVYLIDIGFSGGQVGIVISVSLILSVILQMIIARINQKYNVRKVNSIVLIVASISGILLLFTKSLIGISLAYGFSVGLFNSASPVIERFATLSKFEYGKIRIWGTIGYAVASQIAGIIYQYMSPYLLFVSFSISLLICIIGMIYTVDVRLPQNKEIESSNDHLSKNKRFIIYLLIVGIFYGITNLNTTYLPSMYKAYGINVSIVSSVLFLTTLMELPVTFFYEKITQNRRNEDILILLFILLTVQFFTYGFIHSSLIQMIVTIMTKAVCTMTFIILNMKIIEDIVDVKNQLNALFIVSMIKSAASILIQNIGGILIDLYSFKEMYAVLMALALVGFIVCICFSKMNEKSFILRNTTE